MRGGGAGVAEITHIRSVFDHGYAVAESDLAALAVVDRTTVTRSALSTPLALAARDDGVLIEPDVALYSGHATSTKLTKRQRKCVWAAEGIPRKRSKQVRRA